MRTEFTRFRASIALAALATVLALPGAAEAKAKHHVKPAASTEGGLTVSEQLQQAQQQMAQMQAQLNALQARLDAQNTAPPPPAVVQAQASADAANAKADKALATADSTKAAQTKTDKTVGLMKWAADTTVGGRAFINFSTINQKTAGVNNLSTGTGINVKRVYLEINHKFNDTFSASIVTDAANVTGASSFGNTYSAGATPVGKGLFLKNAFIQAKVDPALWIRAGAAPLPWVPYVEGQNGYRYVENMLIDRVGYGTTADWGIHIGGDLANNHLSYQVSLVDGAGYRVVRVTKSVDVEGRVAAQFGPIWGAVGGYIGKLGNDYAPAAIPADPTLGYQTAKRFNAAAGYKTKTFNLGGEYFYAKNWKNVAVNPATTAYAQDSAQGWSVFSNYNFTPRISLFGRYDWVQPNRIVEPQVRDNYFNVGLQWEAAKILDIALVFKHETVKNGSLSTQSGVIGCTTAETAHSFASSAALASGGCLGNGTYNEFGIFTQFRF
jgi:hypothetical protein